MIRELALLVWLVPAAVHADAIMGPPEDCPRGSRGESSHTDSICAPTTCTVDAECGGGTGTEAPVCAPNVGLCLESRTRMPGGLRPPDVVVTPVTYDVASASCSTDADCTAGTHCVVASRCAPRTATEFVRHSLGCTARGGRVGVAVILTGLLVASRLRWRRSRHVVHRR